MEEKIIWTNGCFDILHKGHIELFKYAKSLGSKLYVGLDSDEKVKRDKGHDRPFNNLSDRITVLESIKYIDKVISFNSKNELESLIMLYKPDTMVVGSDWERKVVVGSKYVSNIKFFNRIDGYSTTNILQWKNL